mmetsp:Transcript_5873/g.8337  ORF Transcript_5873/g.8337 Transcript_5873/m.8337 type:complete len:100 (+) Transcript_5873:1602-1901(+)
MMRWGVRTIGGQRPDGQHTAQGTTHMKNFQIDQSQEESPHSFETAAGDIFYGIIALCVVDQSQLDDTTVKCSSGEASFSLSRNDLITHTHPKKSLHLHH